MTKRPAVRRLAGASIGNFGEIYDFTIYALSAPILARHFFPESDATAALLGTFAVYALAFFARPLGGFVFGVMADKKGRTIVLAWTVTLMGAGTAAIGLLPSYSQIGVAATFLLVLCRVTQGLSMGGESSGSYTYVIESAPPGRRGRWVGIVASFAYSPAAVAGLMILGFRAVMGDAYEEWGWRLPFIMGGLVAVIGYLIRRKLDDPEEYIEAVAQESVSNTVVGVAKQRTKSMLLVVMLLMVQSVAAYLILGYMFTFLVEKANVESNVALYTNAAAMMLIVVMLPVVGAISDRVGRKPVMIVGAVWFIATVYPAFVLASAGTVVGALAGQALIAIAVGIYASAAFTVMLELFPTNMRATGHAISYNLGAAIFGGTTPLIAAALVEYSGSMYSPAFYAIAVSLVGLIGILIAPETRDFTLRHAKHDEAQALEHPTPALHSN
ncbi:MFS transporter [Rhodococcus opacus]|nr:MFS transporter [Rhodococcus opacus]